MPQLPRTRPYQHTNLRHAVPHSPRVRLLARIPIVCLPFTLVLLLPSDILQLRIQVPDFGGEVGHVRAVELDVGAGGANNDVEIEADVRRGEPGGIVGAEADGVVACVV